VKDSKKHSVILPSDAGKYCFISKRVKLLVVFSLEFMPGNEKYIFGPVPSRRLGLSLGLDIVPAKVCTLDCIYCQVGRTTQKTIERREYVPVEAVLNELKGRLEKGLRADFITISGSGEPTLNSRLGFLIDEIKKITSIPVAVLTNGTLLYLLDVRRDCAKADVVLPSLDAGDEQTFARINRPHPDISIKKVVEGLVEFRKEYGGKIWLEVFIVDGVNTGQAEIAAIKRAIEQIKPDKVQLNTAVRPTAEPGVKRVEEGRLRLIAQALGPNCEVIADFTRRGGGGKGGQAITLEHCGGIQADSLLSMLKRRPCSLEDICNGLGLSKNQASKYLSELQSTGLVSSEQINGAVFFKAR
jgi:wyosine [tRNA(Phe)-imidazoG37] synthetase (radical SAM superfamily)